MSLEYLGISPSNALMRQDHDWGYHLAGAQLNHADLLALMSRYSVGY